MHVKRAGVVKPRFGHLRRRGASEETGKSSGRCIVACQCSDRAVAHSLEACGRVFLVDFAFDV